jgi:hypothetical protein
LKEGGVSPWLNHSRGEIAHTKMGYIKEDYSVHKGDASAFLCAVEVTASYPTDTISLLGVDISLHGEN